MTRHRRACVVVLRSAAGCLRALVLQQGLGLFCPQCAHLALHTSASPRPSRPGLRTRSRPQQAPGLCKGDASPPRAPVCLRAHVPLPKAFASPKGTRDVRQASEQLCPSSSRRHGAADRDPARRAPLRRGAAPADQHQQTSIARPMRGQAGVLTVCAWLLQRRADRLRRSPRCTFAASTKRAARVGARGSGREGQFPRLTFEQLPQLTSVQHSRAHKCSS